MLDIELTSSCNFRCLMCPVGNRSLGRAAEFMKHDTFVNILGQSIHGGLEAMRFIGWGEPALHPELCAFIDGATGAGILTHLNTNGSKMTHELARDLVCADLNSIKFSFQGVGRKSYAEMRNVDFFEGMIEAIGVMREAWFHHHAGNIIGRSLLPWIAASTTTTWETPEMIAEFCERLALLVDELSVGKTIFDFMDLGKAKLRRKDRDTLVRLMSASTGDEKAHPDPCPEVFNKLSIHADGSVVVCCNDYDGVVVLGNVNTDRIEDMWRHPKIEAYRERLARKDYDAPLCVSCFDYLGVTG